MNTAELAQQIAGTHKLTSAQAQQLINKVLRTIIAAASDGEEIALAGFGKFKVKDSPARTGRNPATGASINIPASRKLVYAQGKHVKTLLNPID